MPTTLHEIWVKIGANFSQLKTGLGGASNLLNQFGNGMAKHAQGAQALGMAVSAVAYGINKLAKSVIDTYSSFDSSVRNAFSVLGSTTADFNRLTAAAKAVGLTGKASAKEAGDAMYYLASAGYNAQQVLASLNGVLNLSAATQYDLAETSRIVVGLLNTFGMEASKAEQVANSMAATIAYSQANMEKLGDAYKYAAPAAAQLGYSLDETNAALGLLFNAGMAASQAGTALRTGLSRLQRPTKMGTEAIKRLGLTVEEINPQFLTLGQVIKKLEEHNAGLKTSGDELAIIFGDRAAGAFSILARKGVAAYDELRIKSTGTQKAAQMIDTQMSGLTGTIKKMKGAISNLAIEFGESLAPMLGTIANGVKNLFMIFSAMPQSMKQIIGTITLVVGALATLGGPLLLLIGYLPRIIEGFVLVKAGMAAAIGPAGLLVAAVVAAAGAYIYFSTAEERHRKSQEDSIKSMKDSVNTQIEHKKRIIDAANGFDALAKKVGKTKEETKLMTTYYNQMKGEYPGLITGASDYTTVLNQVGAAAATATEEMKRLMQQKLTIDAMGVKQSMNQIKMDFLKEQQAMMDPSNWDRYKNAVMDTFDGVSKEAVKSNRTLMALMGDMAGTSLGAQQMGIQGMKLTESSVATLLEKQGAILGKREKVNAFVLNLQNRGAEIMQYQMNIAQNILEIEQERASAGRALTEENKNRISQLQDEYKAAEILSGAFGKAAARLGANQARLAQIDELGAKPPDPAKPTEADDRSGIGGGESAKDKAKKLSDFLYMLAKERIQAQEGLIKEQSDKELQVAIQYAQLENDARVLELNKWHEDALEEAKKLGVERAKVEDVFAVKKKAVAQQLADDLRKISDTFIDKDIAAEMVRLNNSGTIDMKILDGFKSVMEQKKTEVKQFGELWAHYQSQIDAIDKAVNDRIVNRAKFTMEHAWSKEQFDEGYRAYADFLDRELAKQKEYNDEYIRLMAEKEDLNRRHEQPVEDLKSFRTEMGKLKAEFGSGTDLYETALAQELDYWKLKLAITSEWAGNYLDVLGKVKNLELELWKATHDEEYTIMKGTADAMAEGWSAMWDKMGEDYRISSLRIKDAFDAIKRSFYNMIGQMIAKAIASKVLDMLLDFAGIGAFKEFGKAAAGAGTKVASSSGSFAAVGGQVLSDGIVTVHEGEKLVPAELARKNKTMYERAAGYIGKMTSKLKAAFSNNADGEYKINRTGAIYAKKGTTIVPKSVVKDQQKAQQSGFITDALASVMSRMNPNNIAGSMDSALPRASYGAFIKKSGLLQAHGGEISVPASIVRKRQSDYKEAAGGGSIGVSETNHYNITLQNPVVNDKKYWDVAFQEHITPALKRQKRQTGKRR